MQIHELDNYRGTLGSGAFIAVDDGSDTGKVSTNELLLSTNQNIDNLSDTLNARIDNIIAGGAAPSESEVTDARQGANGVIYSSLGTAIRTMDEINKNDLDSIGNVVSVFPYDPKKISASIYSAFENKTISVVDGTTETASPKYLACGYIPIDPNQKLYFTPDTGYIYSVLCYDSAFAYLGRYGGQFYNVASEFDFTTSTTYINTKYIRIIIAKGDSTALPVSDAYKVQFYNGELPSSWKYYVDEDKYPNNLITEEEAGYIYDPGGDVVLATNGVKTSNFISCSPGDTITFQSWVALPVGGSIWYAAGFYDSTKTFISRTARTIVKEVIDGVSHCVYTFTAPASTAFVRFSHRSYGNGKMMATRTNYENDYAEPVVEQIKFPPKFDEFIKGIAHRGGYYGPENTLPAYKTANEQYGFTYVEADVCMTSDDIPVLLHDTTIDRTSNGNGAIKSMTYAQALQYDFGSWKGAQFTGTKIPTLEQLLIICRNLKLKPYLELKQSAGLTKAQIKIIVDLIKKWGMVYETTFSSFSPDYLKTVLEYIPYARVGLLMNGSSYSSDYHEFFANMNNGLCNMLFMVNSDIYNDASKLSNLVSYGFPIEVWTINSADEMKALPDIISGVVSDDVNFETVIKERDSAI